MLTKFQQIYCFVVKNVMCIHSFFLYRFYVHFLIVSYLSNLHALIFRNCHNLQLLYILFFVLCTMYLVPPWLMYCNSACHFVYNIWDSTRCRPLIPSFCFQSLNPWLLLRLVQWQVFVMRLAMVVAFLNLLTI